MHISKIALFIIISIVLGALAGCGGTPVPNTNANNNAAPKTNSNGPANAFETKKQAEGDKSNDAQAIAPVVSAYYEALKKKDDAGLKKVYSQAAIRELEAGMKSDGKKSLADYIESSEPAGEKPFEVRNEKIDGDTAIAEIKGGSYAIWIKWKFVKENGEWKLAAPSENIKLLGK